MATEYKLSYTASEINEKLGKIDDKLDASSLNSAIDTALADAKAIGEFDGKSAYEYAQDGGYTGTETEFAKKLAYDAETVFNEALYGSDGMTSVTMTMNDFEMGGIFSVTNTAGAQPGTNTGTDTDGQYKRCRSDLIPCTNEFPISIYVKSGGKYKIHFFNGTTWIGEVDGMITESSDNIVSLYSGGSEVTGVRILLGLVTDARTTLDELLSYFTITCFKTDEPIIATREWVMSTIGLIENAEDGEW